MSKVYVTSFSIEIEERPVDHISIKGIQTLKQRPLYEATLRFQWEGPSDMPPELIELFNKFKRMEPL